MIFSCFWVGLPFGLADCHLSTFPRPLPQEDAMAKLEMFKVDGVVGGGGPGEAVASLMKKYQDLKEEYRLYRKKAMHAIQVI